MTCPRCGAVQRGRAKYCSRCGYLLIPERQVRRCPHCKSRVAEGAVTCFMCGRPLEAPRFTLSSLRELVPRLPPRRLWLILPAGLLALAFGMIQPWRAIRVAPYYTPTPTFTATPLPTATFTATPTGTSTATPTPEPEYILYRVQRGDTLLVLAQRYDTTVEAIMAANDLSSEADLRWGFEIRIPVGFKPTATPLGTPPAASGGPQIYVVRLGDTLITIAAKFGTSVEALTEANDLTAPFVLRAGDRLIIPEGPPTPTPTGTPSPTPTLNPAQTYSAPLLWLPGQGEEFRGTRAESPILLSWTSVGLLKEDEWYLVTVRYGTQILVSQLTQATSTRVLLDLRPASDAPTHLFRWEVVVVRQIGTQANGTPEVILISSRSEVRDFYWY